ncbi:LacI family transcriptional regulator [Sporobacter termitidis DSM 10068]|uniref:LacI family transcriptional regulator n=1 Tax=Sporobacter termitidis DSM 10068 TaxID=1123282 RepID=A0A1M5XYB8_9FIRM|nr:substrate-binding domain-containing protein [Sporobacter termitidis]SHI04243.1 LacI family transcriptional regulator [Sporobacter termitidis DSM 10068]
MNENALSLKEIAQTLGVSTSTVSIVLHGRSGVSVATRERVSQLLKTHGYLDRPAVSRSNGLYLFRYSTIGYGSDKNDGFVTSIIDAIGREAREKDYSVSITACHEGEFLKELNMLDENPMEGIILLGSELPLVYENYFADRSTPVVIVDSQMPYCPIDSVALNNEYCVFLALKHLHSLGHRRVGLIHSCLETANSRERFQGFRNSVEKTGLSADPNLIFTVGPSMDDCSQDIGTYISIGRPLPTAFLAESDALAIGCMKALRAYGYRVPEDISIIGFDDIPFSRMVDPMLTTIRVPAEHMGKCAVNLLYNRIKDPSTPLTRQLVCGELILRGSTVPVSAKALVSSSVCPSAALALTEAAAPSI